MLPARGCIQTLTPSSQTEIITDIQVKKPAHAGSLWMEVKVDPGSEANCMLLHKLRVLFPYLCRDGLPKEGVLEPTTAEFTGYGETDMQSLGHVELQTQNIATKKYHKLKFHVLDIESPRILVCHAAAYWIGLIEVLCVNKAPKRQVDSLTCNASQSQSHSRWLKDGPLRSTSLDMEDQMKGVTSKNGPRDRSLTGNYSQDGKAQTKGSGRNGKQATSTVTEDQHRMTASTAATETREVSQPPHTPGKHSVLSEPTRTLQSRQLNNPLRRKSNRNTTQLAQSKQLSGPKMNNNCHSNPDRKYYMPTDGAKTYYINPQGHLQSREDPPEIIKPDKKGKLPDSKEAPIYHQPGSIVINGTEELQALYPNSFDRLGSLKGEYDIKVDPSVHPKQHSRRKVPIESKEAIEKEIDYMLEEGIVVEQIEPTPWVSSATFPKKANGDTRVCLDPKDLNKAIIRENHKPMTVEEIAHKLAGATVYTKADALKAFLQVHLTYKASLLTMFNYHRGRLRFLCMPFGAKMSQDVFQLCMDAILEQCPGVIGIYDDIMIFGTSNEDHDANLINLMNVCQKEGLVLNSKKLELWRECVTFFGAEYSATGMHPDPKKIQGIVEMTAPQDKQQLQSFLGMVNYMGTFIPNLSHHTEPLRSMLKQDAVFAWDKVKTRSFQQIKNLILKANETPLRYYDRTKPVIVQADASLCGLGACLLQEEQPIAFASKSLTDAESRYANIERELLAIIFACQRFSTYLLGRSFIAESDHKPLEMIAVKNLANAPPCLQRMLLQLQCFDITIRYRPGVEMKLVDALSRCPARASLKLNLTWVLTMLPFPDRGSRPSKSSCRRTPYLPQYTS